jgi:hypothetical protein
VNFDANLRQDVAERTDYRNKVRLGIAPIFAEPVGVLRRRVARGVDLRVVLVDQSDEGLDLIDGGAVDLALEG